MAQPRVPSGGGVDTPISHPLLVGAHAAVNRHNMGPAPVNNHAHGRHRRGGASLHVRQPKMTRTTRPLNGRDGRPGQENRRLLGGRVLSSTPSSMASDLSTQTMPRSADAAKPQMTGRWHQQNASRRRNLGRVYFTATAGPW